jgi:hypothetical protein
MSEHSPASTSQFSSIRSEPGEQQRSAEVLTRQAREQASQAGKYLASKTQDYPFGALLLAGLIGYGMGYLIHTSWSSTPREEWPENRGYPGEQTSAPRGHSGDVLRPLA